MNRRRVGEDRGSKETDGCPLTDTSWEHLCSEPSPPLSGRLAGMGVIRRVHLGGKPASVPWAAAAPSGGLAGLVVVVHLLDGPGVVVDGGFQLHNGVGMVLRCRGVALLHSGCVSAAAIRAAA
jgi:hypothetical protein